jgi:AcrR family transcriptional regulator
MPRVSEAHKVARRAQIVEAAIRCFHRNGFHPTTMDDIVRESGLSAGAVYTYFSGKDQLIAAAGSGKLSELRVLLEHLVAAEPVPTPAETIATLVDRIVEITVVGDADMTRIIVNGWGETPHNAALREVVHAGYASFLVGAGDLIRRWREAGHVGPEVGDDSARALLSLLLGFIVQRAVVGPIDPAAYIKGATALVGGPGKVSGTGDPV